MNHEQLLEKLQRELGTTNEVLRALETLVAEATDILWGLPTDVLAELTSPPTCSPRRVPRAALQG